MSSSKHETDINRRFDDIVAPLDSAQRAEALIHRMLSFLAQEVKDLKRRQREGGNKIKW
jgi:hypothetical protein